MPLATNTSLLSLRLRVRSVCVCVCTTRVASGYCILYSWGEREDHFKQKVQLSFCCFFFEVYMI